MTRVLSILLALVVTVSAATPALAETTLEKINRTGVLTIGTRTGSPPFAFVNRQNQWVGFSIDLVEQAIVPAISKKLGKPVRVEKKESTPPTRIPLLSANLVDLIAETMTDTPVRREAVEFSNTFFLTGGQFIVRTGSSIQGLESIAGRRIAVQQGSTNVRIIRERVPSAQLLEFPDQPAAFQALAQGRVDAYTNDGIQLFGLRAKSLNPQEWDVVGAFYTREPYGMAMRKGDYEFRDVVNAGLRAAIQSGRYEALYQKWFGPSGIVPYPMSAELRTLAAEQAGSPAPTPPVVASRPADVPSPVVAPPVLSSPPVVQSPPVALRPPVASSASPSADTPRLPPAAVFGQYYALVIGNEAYRYLMGLKTPVADTTAVADVLRQEYRFRNVRLLTNATRTEMVRAFDDLRRSLGESDNLLIYYAGHGVLDRGADRGYWLPVDAEPDSRANWLSNADITDTVRALKAKHVLVVADSCYSGTLTRSISVTALDSADAVRLAQKRARTVLTSGGLEPVSDVGGGRHSIFARAFLDALRGNRGLADLTSLFGAIRRQVLLNSDQTPQYSDIRQAGHDGGDFLFVRQP